MRFTASAGCIILLLITNELLQAQDTRAFNQNASRSNHTRRGFNQNASRSNHTRLSFSITPVLTSPPPVDDNTDTFSFRGNGGGLRAGADYYFGHLGISFTFGFTSSGIRNDAINNFIQKAGMHSDQVMVNKTKAQQAYLLLGPSFRYGNTFALEGTVKGGLFFNNGGITDIRQKSTGASLYRNEAGNKNAFAGMSYGIRMSYNPASQWAFGIMAEYMHSKTSINNYDSRIRQQVEVPVAATVKTRDLVFGISLIYKIKECRDNAPQTRAQNNNTVRSNRTDNAYRINNDTMPSDPPQTKAQNNNTVRSNRTDNAFRANNDSVPGAPQTRAQNNNTVRSNRTDNAYRINDDSGQDDQPPVRILLVQADLDGDGIFEKNITKKATGKISVNAEGGVEDLQQKAGISTSRSNIPRSGAGKMDANDSIAAPQQRAGVSTSRSNIPRASHGKLQTNNNDDGPAPQQKAGVSTSRSNIPRASHGKLMTGNDGPSVSYGTMLWKGRETAVRVIYE